MKLHRICLALVLVPGLALSLACGAEEPGMSAGDDPAIASDSADSGTASPASGKTYDQALHRDTCAVIDEELVREAVPVAAGVEIERQEIAGICAFTWEGGTANVSQLNVLDSAEKAARRFDRAYRTLTPEEQEQVAAGMKATVEQRRQAGEMTDEQAEAAKGMSGGVAGLAGKTVYEEVPGLADQARYDGTVLTREVGPMGEVTTAASTVYFRSGNLIAAATVDLFQPDDMEVQLAGPSEEQRRENREATLRLARAILKDLG